MRVDGWEFQPVWFTILGLPVVAALGLALYAIRLRQLSRRFQWLMDERLEERARIARELHDTLLQSVQALILNFRNVASRLNPDHETHALIEAALERAEYAVVEGRNRVRDLRGSSTTDLVKIFVDTAYRVGFDPRVRTSVIVEGEPVALHNNVASEIGWILAEALFNVDKHARATSVRLMVAFATRQLSVRFEDNGAGLPADVKALGQKPGHFGLVGMRERTERIGGRFAIESQPGSGTTICLSIPAAFAYEDHIEGASRWWGPRNRLDPRRTS